MQYLTKYGFKVSIEIIRDNVSDTAKIKVIAPMYINKEWIMQHSYKSSEFTDYEIMRDSDFISTMLKHYPN